MAGGRVRVERGAFYDPQRGAGGSPIRNVEACCTTWIPEGFGEAIEISSLSPLTFTPLMDSLPPTGVESVRVPYVYSLGA